MTKYFLMPHCFKKTYLALLALFLVKNRPKSSDFGALPQTLLQELTVPSQPL